VTAPSEENRPSRREDEGSPGGTFDAWKVGSCSGSVNRLSLLFVVAGSETAPLRLAGPAPSRLALFDISGSRGL